MDSSAFRRFVLCKCIFVLLCSLNFTAQAQIIKTLVGGSVGDGRPSIDMSFAYFEAITTDSSENMYIWDKSNRLIRKIDAATGVITSLAGGGQQIADSLPAFSIKIDSIRSLAVDKSGNVYLGADFKILKLDIASGKVFRIAGKDETYWGDGGLALNAGFTGIRSIAFDPEGNLFIADGNRIRKIMTSTGIISTISGYIEGYYGDGGPAANALFRYPTSISIDDSGNIYVGDMGNHVIRKISGATGKVSTIAGVNGGAGSTGDSIPATSAIMSFDNVVCDKMGNVYYSESGYYRLRKITAATGIVKTIVGKTNVPGNSGDGGPATSATIGSSRIMTVDKSGNF
jgi:hypothetical protein